MFLPLICVQFVLTVIATLVPWIFLGVPVARQGKHKELTYLMTFSISYRMAWIVVCLLSLVLITASPANLVVASVAGILGDIVLYGFHRHWAARNIR